MQTWSRSFLTPDFLEMLACACTLYSTLRIERDTILRLVDVSSTYCGVILSETSRYGPGVGGRGGVSPDNGLF